MSSSPGQCSASTLLCRLRVKLEIPEGEKLWCVEGRGVNSILFQDGRRLRAWKSSQPRDSRTTWGENSRSSSSDLKKKLSSNSIGAGVGGGRRGGGRGEGGPGDKALCSHLSRDNGI